MDFGLKKLKKFDRYKWKFVITEFVITEFVITEFVITEFVISEFVVTEFHCNAFVVVTLLLFKHSSMF
jgi:hypothetical protein